MPNIHIFENRMKKPANLFLFLSILFIQLDIAAQNEKLDSLWNIYNNKTEADSNRIKALYAIAWGHSSNNPDTAILLSEELLEFGKTLPAINEKKWASKAFNTIAVSYLNKSNYTKALEYNLKGLKINEELGSKKNIANSYYNIGNVYATQAINPKALEYFLKSLKIREEINDEKGKGNCYRNIGSIYMIQLDYTKALEYQLKALKMSEVILDKKGIGQCYSNIGNIYQYQSNNEKALDYLNKSLKISEELNDKIGIGSGYCNLGSVYRNSGNFSDAIKYYLKSLKIRTGIGDKQGVAVCYNSLAEINYENGMHKTAVLYGDSALSVSKQIGDIFERRFGYENIARANAKMGKYKEAYECYVKFKGFNDSIFNIDNSKQLGDLKTKFEVEKKEVELKAEAEAQKVITEEEKKRREIVIYSIAALLILVLVFAILIFNRFKLTQKQKQIIELQKEEVTRQKYLVEEHQKEIIDSINYAERIQRSFIATKEILDENLNDYFVFFKPKDIVSGDFYWAGKLNNGNFAIATADSTGHGVPGAIMSLLNVTSLEKAIETHVQPSEILNTTRKMIIDRLKKDGSAEGGKDGMDASLTVYDFNNKKLIIAAANNPVWIVRGAETIEIKPDKMPVGKHDKDNVSFTQQEVDLQAGDIVYTFTDGLPDQFGGLKGKKFMYKKLKELLISISCEPMEIQKQKLTDALNNWQGDLEQVDDVTLIGVRV